MYQLQTIGECISGKGETVLYVKKEFRKALKYLEEFSHVHVFYISTNSDAKLLSEQIAQVKSVDRKTGCVCITDTNLPEQAVLVDIKPYFSSEDSVKTCRAEFDEEYQIKVRELDSTFDMISDKASEWDGIHYEVGSAGTLRNLKGEQYIQLSEETAKIYKMPMAGSFIKIFWWFHKFDAKQYRAATECNQPYENAPKTGIFATRSPVRPNPIAMTVTRVLRTDVEKGRIYINEIESFDKTPCIGITGYHQAKDFVENARVPAWLRHWPKWIEENESDGETESGQIICYDSCLSELLQKENVQTSYKNPYLQLKAVADDVNDGEIINKPDGIIVVGARENNLQGLHVKIPYGKITAVVGVSGSGKSSLVNDTIYAECRRRMEYLSHSRNLLQKPKAESITGCIPAVIISQEPVHGNVFSTVGTYSNAYDYLRVIFANAATRHCPTCGNEIIPLSKDAIVSLLEHQEEVQVFDLAKQPIACETLEESIDRALATGEGAFYAKISGNTWILLQTKQKCYHCDKVMFTLTSQTFSYVDNDSRCSVCNGTGSSFQIDEAKVIVHPKLSLLDGACAFYGNLRSFIDKPNANWVKGQVFGLASALHENLEKPWNELSLEFREQLLHGSNGKEVTFSYQNKKNGRNGQISRPVEGIFQIINRAYEEHPDSKSLERYMTKMPCSACKGERLNRDGRMVTLASVRYPEAAAMTFSKLSEFCYHLLQTLTGTNLKKVENAISSLLEITRTAKMLGIGYLPLNREIGMLSFGEGQRVKLLGAAVNHMTGILYVFDEPSKGLHPKDYERVKQLLLNIKREGNTVIIVEHNEDMIRAADYVVEIGPGAGKLGGQLVGEGSLNAMLDHKGTQISQYMNPENVMKLPYEKQQTEGLEFVNFSHLKYRNLKDISIRFPINALTCICGVSGSGKSSLMKGEILSRAMGTHCFSEVLLVDQQPIGKTSKSIVATYIGVMDSIRQAFAMTDQAQKCGYDDKYFSFNGELGQCQTCRGEGRIKIKYLEDSYMQCVDCKGKRYQKKILDICLRDRHIADILDMSAEEAMHFFAEESEMQTKLAALCRVGLSYLKLGQNTSTLSGGEASRLKLARELMGKKRNKVLYLLDEPTTGLHFSDISHLLELVSELVKDENTVIAIEHNKQFLSCCDWCIELGPGAGDDGGTVISQKQNL